MADRVDPFVFVAAERYAIRRWLTGASETVARQCVVHKDVICSDMGVRSAILSDIEDLLSGDEHPAPGGSREEWEAHRARWREVAAALDDQQGSATGRTQVVSEVKRIDIAEFRREGYVQEVNRRFLHPLGLALEVVVNDDGTETLGGVWDYRDDPEGIYFESHDLSEKAKHVDRLWTERETPRREALGYVVQPVSASDDGR